MNTGSSSHKPARRRSMGKWSLFFLNPTGEFGSTCGWLGSLLRTVLVSGQLTAVDGLILLVVEQQCKKENTKGLSLGHGMSDPYWIELLLQDLKAEQRLSQRYRVDIARLSETRIADEGSLREEGGKLQAEDRIHGVGFAISTALLRSMPMLPVGINERLMKLRIPLSRIRYLTIISAYAATLTSPDNARNNFMNSLSKSSGQPHRETN